MHYVCLENNLITSILNYQPNVPETVQVVEISDADYEKLINRTHFFDVSTKSVIAVSPQDLQDKLIQDSNVDPLEFLSQTDWKVLRHIRQKALGVRTTLSESEYLDLERQRDEASKQVR